MNKREYDQLAAELATIKALLPGSGEGLSLIKLVEEKLAQKDPEEKKKQWVVDFTEDCARVKDSLAELECFADVITNQGMGDYAEMLHFLYAIGIISPDEALQVREAWNWLNDRLSDWEQAADDWLEVMGEDKNG